MGLDRLPETRELTVRSRHKELMGQGYKHSVRILSMSKEEGGPVYEEEDVVHSRLLEGGWEALVAVPLLLRGDQGSRRIDLYQKENHTVFGFYMPDD